MATHQSKESMPYTQANSRIPIPLSNAIDEQAKKLDIKRGSEIRRCIKAGFQALYGFDPEEQPSRSQEAA